MICWSASFYPQPIHNYRRRSTAGLAIDFPTINVLGFVCYLIYTSAFLYSPVIRRQYAARHPLSEKPSVRYNDLAFALHATVLSIIIYSQFWPQIWKFQVSRFQRASKPILGLFWGSLVAIAVVVCFILARSPDGGYEPSSWAWIDVVSIYPFIFLVYYFADELQLYALSYVKLVITIVKYVPQAWVNYKRKSTVGWSIVQILFDLAGGALSLIQLILDSSYDNDWSGITGNPVKFLLGNVTVFFDFIFVVQHYILYRHASEEQAKPSNREPELITPLLEEPDDLLRATRE